MALDPLHPRPARGASSRSVIPESPGSVPEARVSLEALLDDALACLAGGEVLALEDYRARLPSADWARFAGTARAEEYRWRLGQEEDVAPEPLLEGLDEDARVYFFRALAMARLGRGVLPHRLEPGCVIRGRWLIQRRLGSGGQAKVYAAWDRELELEVALKAFDEPLTQGQSWSQAALSESRALARLRSRNIVRVFDILREDGLTLVVMSLVRGIRLREALDRLRSEEADGADPRQRTARLRAAIGQEREGEYTDLLQDRSWYRTAARIGLVMARTLEQAHQNGTAHRDLNPKNAMLVGGGEPVLLDFGLATRHGVESPKGWTLPYVAPECLGECAVGDSGADLYQLGLVLYELFTLERAFALREGESSNAVLFRIARGEFPPPRESCPTIPEALEAICRHALRTRPEARYGSAGDLVRDLERFLRVLPPLTAPLRLSARIGMRARHAATSPLALGLAALVAVAFVPAALARDSWMPPRVSALRTRAEPSVVETIRTGQVIVRGDWELGVEVDCPSLTYLYAFRLAGESVDQEDLSVSPASCLVLGDDSNQDEPGTLRLEPGNHLVLCLDLREAEARTGLLLVFSPRENAVLEALRSELAVREERFEPVRYGALSGLLAMLSTPPKGQTLSGLDPEARRKLHALARAVRPATGLGEVWKALGVQEYVFVFPVLSSQEEQADD